LGGRTVRVAVLVGVGLRSSTFRVVRVFVGVGVGFTVGFCTDGGGEGTAVVLGGTVGVAVTDGVELLSSTTGASWFFDSFPSNRPIADKAQKFTARNSTSAHAPANTTRREGPAYRPTGPRTALPLPSTQKFQSSGAGGQEGSGRQVFGGIQLRRGGVGQFGGTTNRFTNPPRHDQRPDPG